MKHRTAAGITTAFGILWNGGNGWGTVKLYDREDGQLILTDEIEASHIGCEYGEYDHGESY